MQNYRDVAPHTAGSYRRQAPTDVNRAVALAFARAGVRVFPCDARKRPLTPRGHHDASDDLNMIEWWWTRSPGALVGIPTGPPSGVWVLDVDGDVGRQSLNRLLAELGLETPFDLTPIICRTPSGGLHLYFRLRAGERPRTRAGDIAPGLDTRGVKADGSAGGYVIAPGCVLPDGRRYELIGPASLLAAEIAP